MSTVVSVIVGGAIGALSRYGVDRVIEQRSDSSFPWSTFVINVTGCVLVGKMTDEVPCAGGAELPARRLRQRAHEIVQGAGRQIRGVQVQLLALTEGAGDVRNQLVLACVLAEHKGTAKVGLPDVEHRPQVEVHDVVGLDAPIRWLVVVGQHGIRSGTHHAPASEASIESGRVAIP